jgi:excisionase family DNA binding protein
MKSIKFTKQMFTSRELARLLNVHINTVRRWSDRGLLNSYRIGNRGDRRFSREDVINFLVVNSHQSKN